MNDRNTNKNMFCQKSDDPIQFNVRRVLMSKTVPFQTIQFSINTQFKCNYTFYFSKTILFQAIQFSQQF